MRQLLDASGDVIQVFHHDDSTGLSHIQTWHDPTAILDNNSRLRGMNDGYNKARDFKRVASIPLGIIYQCLAKYGVEPKTWMQWSKHERAAFYRRIASDPDYAHVRTAETSGQNRVRFQVKAA